MKMRVEWREQQISEVSGVGHHLIINVVQFVLS